MSTTTTSLIEAVWREESGRVIATLTRLTRDLSLAEELAQEALLSAMEKWPTTGVPKNPCAWLITTGKNRALDLLRKRRLVARKGEELKEIGATSVNGAAIEDAMDEPISDDMLRLVFISCHPVLPMEARVALTLRVP